LGDHDPIKRIVVVIGQSCKHFDMRLMDVKYRGHKVGYPPDSTR
jgi:hypothetical protein